MYGSFKWSGDGWLLIGTEAKREQSLFSIPISLHLVLLL